MEIPAHLIEISTYNESLQEDEDCENGKRYLGTVAIPDNGIFLVDQRLDPNLLFKFPSQVLDYSRLPEHPQHRIFGNIQLFQIDIKDQMYTAIIKTFWIRMIQIAWKKRLQTYRNSIIKNIFKIMYQSSRLPYPSCRGMLRDVLFVKC
jgi:hypothetical protein